MYNATIIKAAFLALHSWRQNSDPAGVQISAASGLTTAGSSDLNWNAYSPLLTFNNLLSAAELEHIDKTDLVALGDAFSDWLKNKTEDFIIVTIDRWLAEKFELKTARNLLERPIVFETSPSLSSLQVKAGKIVGHIITPKRERGIKTTLKRVSFRFNQAETFTLYLYKAGEPIAIESWPITYTGSGGEEWTSLNIDLDNSADHYLAYDENEITGQAINSTYDWSEGNVGRTRFPTGKHVKIRSFSADADIAFIWDPALNVSTISTNYGMNLHLNVSCDYTEFIVDQIEIFKSLVGFGVAIEFLNLFGLNPSVMQNRHMVNMDQRDINFQIMGDSTGRKGLSLQTKFEGAMSGVMFDTAGLGSACLAVRKRGVRHTSIGPWKSGAYGRY